MERKHLMDGIRVSMMIKASFDAYEMWFSADATRDWARQIGVPIEAGAIAGRRVHIKVDTRGLYDLRVDEESVLELVHVPELAGIVAEFIPSYLRHLWPCHADPTSRTQ